jgi:hypothetical protein
MTARRMSADIARCLNDDCPQADKCSRNQDPPPVGRSRRQVYAAFQPDPQTGECDEFIESKKS